MNRLALSCAALAMTAAFAPTAHASVEIHGPTCGFTAFSNPFGDNLMAVEIDGGPMVFHDSADPTRVVAGRLICTVQVNAPTHDGPDTVSLRSVTAPVAVVEGVVDFYEPPASNLYLCTQVDLADGTTLYWDAPYGGDESWSTDPHSACAWAVSPDDPEPEPTPEILGWVDAIVCPVLAVVSPPEGDVPGLWDCPPYAR